MSHFSNLNRSTVYGSFNLMVLLRESMFTIVTVFVYRTCSSTLDLLNKDYRERQLGTRTAFLIRMSFNRNIYWIKNVYFSKTTKSKHTK